MNDSFESDTVEFLPSEKTYNLGKGISVRVAKVTPKDFRHEKIGCDGSVLQSPRDSRNPSSFIQKRSVSPHSVMNDRRPMTHGQVFINGNSSKKAPRVVDYSKSGTKKKHITSRVTHNENHFPRKPSLNKYMSESDLSVPLFAQNPYKSMTRLAKPIQTSKGPSLQKGYSNQQSRQSLVPPDFDQGSLYSEIHTQMECAEKTQKELQVQWQDLVMRVEALEYLISESQEKIVNLSSPSQVLLKSKSVSNKDKGLFLLRRVFGCEDDEECRLMAGLLISQLEEEGFLTEEMVNDFETLSKRLDFIGEKKKTWLEAVHTMWTKEFCTASEVLEGVAREDEKLRNELLAKMEEIELTVPDILDIVKKSFASEEFTEENVKKQANLIYLAQIKRIKEEGFERITTSLKEIRVILEECTTQLCEELEDLVSVEDLKNQLEGLDSDSTEVLSTLLHLSTTFCELISQDALPRECKIDYCRLLQKKIETHLPCLSPMFLERLNSLEGEESFGSLEDLQPILERIMEYCLLLLKLRSCEKVQIYIEEKINGVQDTIESDADPTQPEAISGLYSQGSQSISYLKRLEEQCKKVSSQEDPLSMSIHSYGSSSTSPKDKMGEAAKIYMLSKLQALHLGIKNKLYSGPVRDIRKMLDRAVDIFNKSEWVSAKIEYIQTEQLSSEIKKHCQKTRDLKESEENQKEDNLNKINTERAHLLELQKEHSSLSREMSSVKALMNNFERHRSKSRGTLSRMGSVSSFINSGPRKPLGAINSNTKDYHRQGQNRLVAPKKGYQDISSSRQRSTDRGAEPPLSLDEIDPLVFMTSEEHQKVSILNSMISARCPALRHHFLKRVLKHLEAEFNLEENSRDWLSRGVVGISCRKGPRVPIGYSGPKKIDVLNTWTKMSKGVPIDLEKMGHGTKIIRLNSAMSGFEIYKPGKRLEKYSPNKASIVDNSYPSESLANHSLLISDTTKKIIWEQLGKSVSSFIPVHEKKVLQNCMLYSVELVNYEASNFVQITFEDVRSFLSFLVAASAIAQS